MVAEPWNSSPGKEWSFPLWRHPKATWRCPGRGVGWDDLQRSLPVLFCENITECVIQEPSEEGQLQHISVAAVVRWFLGFFYPSTEQLLVAPTRAVRTEHTNVPRPKHRPCLPSLKGRANCNWYQWVQDCATWSFQRNHPPFSQSFYMIFPAITTAECSCNRQL